LPLGDFGLSGERLVFTDLAVLPVDNPKASFLAEELGDLRFPLPLYGLVQTAPAGSNGFWGPQALHIAQIVSFRPSDVSPPFGDKGLHFRLGASGCA
jgi:hypothetical protein